MRIVIALVLAMLTASVPSFGQGTQPTTIYPPVTAGYGTLSVSTSSIAVSTLTAGPNSPSYPTGLLLPSRFLSVRNSIGSAGVLYVCLYGGTCTAAVGTPLAIGESKTWTLNGTTSPTVIAASTATLVAEW